MKTKTIKYLSFVTVAAAAAFGIYRHSVLTKYEYWNQLIAQDPKPSGVSEQEYREKLRAGYCWRDKKFYTSKELHQKAMVSFSGRLLEEAEAYRTDMTTNQGGRAYTSADCARSETACRVWFVSQNYTNEQWDKWFLKTDYATEEVLKRYPVVEIKQPEDLKNYLTKQPDKGFSLILRYADADSGDVYGSDCCKVLNKKEAEPKVKGKKRVTDLNDGIILPENDIPPDTKIEDYGVGNFYFEFNEVIPGIELDTKHKTYQWDASKVLLMNNCGDVLSQPYYIDIHKNGKE